MYQKSQTSHRRVCLSVPAVPNCGEAWFQCPHGIDFRTQQLGHQSIMVAIAGDLRGTFHSLHSPQILRQTPILTQDPTLGLGEHPTLFLDNAH